MTTLSTHKKIDENAMFSAIDIGSTKVVALTGYRNERGEIVVLGHGTVNSVNLDIDKEKEKLNIENIRKAIHAAVDAAHKEAGFFCKNVVVGTAGRFMRSSLNRIDFKRVMPFESITSEEIDRQCKQKFNELVAYEEEILHVKELQYVVDGQFYNTAPVGKMGSSVSLNVCIMKMKREYLQQLRLLIEQCGLKVAEFMLEPLASSAAVLTENERNAGCTLVDIGGGTTDMALYEAGKLQFAEVIPLGGNCITNDIRQIHIINALDGGEIRYATEDWYLAEQIKLRYGKCWTDESDTNQTIEIKTSARQDLLKISLFGVAQTIQNRMNEIVASVHNMIRYSNCSAATKQGIVLTGGGAELKYIKEFFEQKFLEQRLHCEVRIAAPNRVEVRSQTFDCNNPRYATIVGLLMRAAELHAKTYIPPVETPKAEIVEKPQEQPQAQAPTPTQAPVATQAPPKAPETKVKPEPKPEPPKIKETVAKSKKNIISRISKTVGNIAGAVFTDPQNDESKN